MVDKANCRAALRRQLRELDPAYLKNSNAQITERLLQMPEYQNAGRLFAYYSVGREVDTHMILRRALADGKQVLLPRSLPDGVMQFAAFTGETDLVKGAMSIPEPAAGLPPVWPEPQDLMLVPGLSFDGQCFRMGQGGGYYDRWLAQWKMCTIGLCREKMLSQRLFREAHDRAVDCVLTEARLLRQK